MKMAQIQELKAETRAGRGKGPAFQARQKGLIPGVIYGGANDVQTVSVDGRTLERHVEAGHFLTTLFLLDIAGAKTRVIPREVQLDPVSDRPVHVDFMRLAEGASVKLNIPVHFHGQDVSPGLKKGGVLNIARHSIVLLCPAENIPNTIEVDVSGLDINDTVHFEDLTLPDGVKPVARGRDTTVCSIVASTTVREEQKAAAAAADAPAAAAEAAPAAAPAAGAAAPAAGGKAAPAAAAKPAAKK
jgi:large subunit ribosomal protein L25